MSASITLSGAAQQGVSHKILATLRRFEIVEVNERLNQSDFLQNMVISDFLLEKDRMFASLTLDEEELKLYQQILWSGLKVER